ncbi:NADPH:quinone reductase-like Zn-dependent oxidoreductase [Thermosporothrix hazakensis]|jgi:NADPH:quinone reductase-like Zn-dependent oxidoreductase|uniref:NADPH:quinone reductase-like Zn-dependent oxidoreductase n=2 Tax=Thermosporothrix TaxID=768650 RepID=A0A326UBK6_THEHA|nr:zinc-binding dehydrogenase [Thermosporothrix hazakensis]PZW35887.1 NADPH:quinone reductase-like Zn-dependent oxidoreductase [Thermosporothrix hazakensis]BBH88353.1 alcohol dehydrogenase [Thermosporothrix sp. COM3]GCE46540.1 alcohol dehydrogenase [Thermosporothrix hazakensis]
MKAALFHEHGDTSVLRIEDVPEPTPGPTDVIVKVHACGINRLDIYSRTGRTKVAPMPHIAGSEVAGEIAALGNAVSGLQIGQAVVVAPYLFCGVCEFCRSGEECICLRGDIVGLGNQGGYAEYVRVPATNIVPLPEGVDTLSAAAVGLAAITAWHMLTKRVTLHPGQDVLILSGGSGVGSAAIQFAKLSGARVITTVSTEEKRARALELGADEVIHYHELDFLKEVRRLTNKRGVDVVIEHVGAETWEKSVACLSRNGKLVTCGATTGNESTLNIWNLFAKEMTLIGSYGGTRQDLAEVLKLVAAKVFEPVIDSTYPLEEIARAHSRLESRQSFGKILVTPRV